MNGMIISLHVIFITTINIVYGGNLNSIPVISQCKSLVEVISGDEDAARQTQEQFIRTCPGFSQMLSLGEAMGGNNEEARLIQEEFAGNAVDAATVIPGVGHIIGAVHAANGDMEKAATSFKASTKTIFMVPAGIFGGPAGALAAGVAYDTMTDGVQSLLTEKPFSEGVGLVAGIVRQKETGEPMKVEEAFAHTVGFTTDSLMGFRTRPNAAQRTRVGEIDALTRDIPAKSVGKYIMELDSLQTELLRVGNGNLRKMQDSAVSRITLENGKSYQSYSRNIRNELAKRDASITLQAETTQLLSEAASKYGINSKVYKNLVRKRKNMERSLTAPIDRLLILEEDGALAVQTLIREHNLQQGLVIDKRGNPRTLSNCAEPAVIQLAYDDLLQSPRIKITTTVKIMEDGTLRTARTCSSCSRYGKLLGDCFTNMLDMGRAGYNVPNNVAATYAILRAFNRKYNSYRVATRSTLQGSLYMRIADQPTNENDNFLEVMETNDDGRIEGYTLFPNPPLDHQVRASNEFHKFLYSSSAAVRNDIANPAPPPANLAEVPARSLKSMCAAERRGLLAHGETHGRQDRRVERSLKSMCAAERRDILACRRRQQERDEQPIPPPLAQRSLKSMCAAERRGVLTQRE